MPTPEFGADDFDALVDLTAELSTKQAELGDMLAVEREQRVRAWEDADTDKVTAADRYADAATLDLSMDIARLKGEIAGLRTEWEFLMAWMQADG